MKQLELFKNNHRKLHGGQINQGKRKNRRPLASKQPLHVVLKCNQGISVQHDHIHLLIKIPERESYKKFTRALAGVLARKYGKGLWRLFPFTRVLSWGREYEIAKNYISQNEDEIWGLTPYLPRKRR